MNHQDLDLTLKTLQSCYEELLKVQKFRDLNPCDTRHMMALDNMVVKLAEEFNRLDGNYPRNLT